ncbi:lytic transglycosylase domain-containing protein [Bdellovibrionota bacterium FG-2]
METQTRKKISTWILFSLPFTLASFSALAAPVDTGTPREHRVAHARELLGTTYKRSVVRKSERLEDVEAFVAKVTRRALRGKWARFAPEVSKTILQESETRGFDPIFLMAMIENESSFQPAMRGGAGEIGLMQILPSTGKWISKKAHLPWKGKKTLEDPVANIRLGVAFISVLRDQFDAHGRLYMAAYNMGARNVQKAMGKKIWPKDYPRRVMQRYIRFYSELSLTQPVLTRSRTLASK